MKELKRKVHVFQDAEAFTTHYEALFSHDLHAPEFKAALTHIQDEKPVKGSYKITHILYGCPECDTQLLTQESSVYDGKDWRKIEELSRTAEVPQNANILIPLQKSA